MIFDEIYEGKIKNIEYIRNMSFIYIVNLNPPSGIRAFEISKRLIKEKITPIILTKSNRKNRIFELSLMKKITSSLKIYRILGLELKNKYILFLLNYIFRFDFYIDWLPFCYLKAKKILKKKKKIKFIYATGPHFYTHIIGYLLKRKYNIPLIVEYRDPWSFTPYNEKYQRYFNKKIDVIIERIILKSADMIVTVSPALISFLKSKFPFIKSKPIYSISNGLNINSFNSPIKQDTQKIVFTFTGRLYGKRKVTPLLKIISNLKKQEFFKNIDFKFQIFGRYEERSLQKTISDLEIVDLIYLGGFISRERVLEEINACDIAIHIGENLDYPTISYKVWEYMSCKKKILYLGLEDSYTAKFLKKNDLGLVVPLNNLSKGQRVLKELLNNLKSNNFDTSINEDKLNEYSWDNKVKKLEQILLNFF